MTYPLQSSIPYNPFVAKRLPGIAPLDPADWLLRDEAFAAQMALRDRLIAHQRADVIAQDKVHPDTLAELLDSVLAHLTKDAGYRVGPDVVIRPDGQGVDIDRSDPLAVLGRLVQEDFCVLEKCEGEGDEHVLTAAVLCFPASWRLSEKIGRPLIGIHDPVAAYSDDIAKRVQRLFNGIQVDRPLWRYNCLWYDDPQLFQPRSAVDPRPTGDPSMSRFLRSERQSLKRLPQSKAVIFSIHSYVLPQEATHALQQAAGLLDVGHRSGAVEHQNQTG